MYSSYVDGYIFEKIRIFEIIRYPVCGYAAPQHQVSMTQARISVTDDCLEDTGIAKAVTKVNILLPGL